MKEYPTISREYLRDIPIYAFDKLDGSNIRAEWSKKRGFYKFGTRTQLIDSGSPIFGESIAIFDKKYSQDLQKIFVQQKWDRAVCFFEFGGPNSFAGNHEKEEHDVMLFDVSVNDHLLDPRTFVRIFEDVETPKLIHQGKAGEEFITNIRESKIEGVTLEGVVCKGHCSRKTGDPVMFKIKSNAWIEQLKIYCKGNNDLLARLL